MTAELPSTRPYLIRALHEWCTDNGFTPYLAVSVDHSVRVPVQHVVNGEIVLNVSIDATSALVMGNEYIEFKARFGGVPQEISVPTCRVLAIYARENGQGMAFPVETSALPGVHSGGESEQALSGQVTGVAAKGLALVEGSGDSGNPSEVPPSGEQQKSDKFVAKSKPSLKLIK